MSFFILLIYYYCSDEINYNYHNIKRFEKRKKIKLKKK